MAVGYVQETSDWYESRNLRETSGPDSVFTYEEPDDEFVRNPVGFVWPSRVEKEPLIWNGDNA